MGKFKKESERRARAGGVKSDSTVKGENFYRDVKKLKTLRMFKDGKATRNRDGKIVKAASYQSKEIPIARIEPHRKWFTNSRVITQEALNTFRAAIASQTSDPYSYLLKRGKLPMTLVRDEQRDANGVKKYAAKVALDSMPFSETFGPKARKRQVKLEVDSLQAFSERATQLNQEYENTINNEHNDAIFGPSESDVNIGMPDGSTDQAREPIFSKGQSRRLWNELYKVIDSSDVLIHVLDARDPLGTRCLSVEKYIKKEAAHKHILFALNKCDLIPSSIASRWVKHLSKEYPTLAFKSSVTNPFGKGALINVLRQFSSLHTNRRQISVGFIGYPNTGKSSMINALRGKKVCNVAPIPGETKDWQYISLMKRIYLIDCPGIVPPRTDLSDTDILLHGVVRVERVETPSQYIDAVIQKCRPRHVSSTYEVTGYQDSTEFLEMLSRKRGRLLKGGEADIDGTARVVLNDFIRGKLPWFTLPPELSLEPNWQDTQNAGKSIHESNPSPSSSNP